MSLRTIKPKSPSRGFQTLSPIISISALTILIVGIVGRWMIPSATSPSNTGQLLTGTSIDNISTVNTGDNVLDWKIGNTITIAGIITATADSTLPYSHMLTTSDNIKYRLIATTVPLTTDGFVEIKGTISAIVSSIPVIQVQSSKTLNNSSFKTKQGSLYLDRRGLIIDTTASAGSTATVSGDTISIQTSAGSATIRPFVCSKSSKTTNCTQIVKDLDKPETQSFAGSNSQLFYQIGGVTDFITIHTELLRGYRIQVDNDQTLIEVSSMMTIIDKQFLETVLGPDLKQACNKLGPIKELSSLSIASTTPDTILSIKALTDSKQSIECTAKLSLGKTIPFVVLNVKSAAASTQNNTDTTLVNPLVYRTSAGYHLMRPSDIITPKAKMSRQNFDIIGLRCQTQVSLYPKETPDLSGSVIDIFLCTSQRPADQLRNNQTKTMIHLSTGEQHIFIRTNDIDWTTFASSIIVQ